MKYPIRFGKYLLLERVNVGGMAEVFKAKTFGVEGFQRNLAIKRILPNMSEDDEFIKMFVDEARLAVQLNHANIVQIYELGKHENQYYIAMEYVGGKDLRRIVEWYRKRKQTMPVPLAAYICSKICEGLDFAHRKHDQNGNPINLVHRDVSPQNILISFDGDVKVIDFGIAKAADRLSKTQAGVLKGKFGYMSPEQVAGMEIDRRSDLFAVGVLLYEMLTCQRLFVAETDFSTLEKVRQCEIPPMRERNVDVPDELEHVVRTALARDLDERYQWCSDFAEALQPFLITDKTIFNAKRLSSFMKETFKEDIDAEMLRMQEYAKITEADVPELPAGGFTNVGAAPGGTQPHPGEGTQIFDVNNDALASAHTHVGPQEESEAPLTGRGPSGTKKLSNENADPSSVATQVFDNDEVDQVQQQVASEIQRKAIAATVMEDSSDHTRRFDQVSDVHSAAFGKQKWILLGAAALAVSIVLLALLYRSRSAESELAWMVLQVDPLGVPVELSIDGQLVAKGTTPLDNRQLSLGRHQLKIDAGPAYMPIAVPIELKSGTNQVSLQLKAKPASAPLQPPSEDVPPPRPRTQKLSLEIEVDPPGTAVTVNGQRVGKKLESELGKALVFEARRAGYKPLRREVVVKGEDKIQLKLEKEAKQGGGNSRPPPPTPTGVAFLIVATPGNPDTKVIVDGKDTKRVTPIPPSDPLKIGAGAHKVILEFVDGTKKTVPVQISAGETFKMIEKKQ